MDLKLGLHIFHKQRVVKMNLSTFYKRIKVHARIQKISFPWWRGGGGGGGGPASDQGRFSFRPAPLKVCTMKNYFYSSQRLASVQRTSRASTGENLPSEF